MEHPKAKGDRSTLAVMLALHEAGWTVFLPFGENTRCDLVIEGDGVLARVQCKTGRLSSGAVRFNTCSSYAHHPNPKVLKRDYVGEVEYFGVYCRDTGGVYLVPIDDVPLRREAALRVEVPKNNQQLGVRWAGRYEVGTIRLRPTAGPGAIPGAAGSCA